MWTGVTLRPGYSADLTFQQHQKLSLDLDEGKLVGDLLRDFKNIGDVAIAHLV